VGKPVHLGDRPADIKTIKAERGANSLPTQATGTSTTSSALVMPIRAVSNNPTRGHQHRPTTSIPMI